MTEPLVIQTLKDKRAMGGSRRIRRRSRRPSMILPISMHRSGCLRTPSISGRAAERVMIERRLDATDTTLRNSVVFKVSKPYVTRPGASWSVWWRSAKACATGRRATPSRCASLPIAGPRPADRSGKHIKDQPIHQHAITFLAMVFKPGGVNGIGAEIFAAHRVMLAADHAA